MSGKITLILLVALGIVVYLGVKNFGAAIKEMGRVRQNDFSEQQAILSGEKRKMKVLSTAFENGGSIPKDYTCDGADINPRLEISDVPEETKSLVLLMDDPDAVGGVWDHWLVWNISPTTQTIGIRSVPKGAHIGINDYGEFGYSGPCPPLGEHRYMFRLYALDEELDLASSANRIQLEEAMEDHIIEKTGLMGRYERE
jgi:Raf kinase inhibitor-like YbhB/YbcL family protein